MTVQERVRDLQEALAQAPTAREKLSILITLGEESEQASRTLFGKEDKVPGCASDTFIKAELRKGKTHFTCFSASLVIKGYVALLLTAFQGSTPREIRDADDTITTLTTATGLDTLSITPSRTNSFSRLYAFMKEKAAKAAND